MKEWLIGVMTVLVAVLLITYIPTTERQKKGITIATAVKSQGDMVLPSTGEASDKVPDSNVMPVAVISVYHGDGGSLMRGMDFLDTERLDVQLLVDRLIGYGVLTDGAKALSFDVEGKDENVVETLDLSRAESAEGCSDEMFLTEISNTFTENFELSKLKLKVNGANCRGDDVKQGDNGYLTHSMGYESIE